LNMSAAVPKQCSSILQDTDVVRDTHNDLVGHVGYEILAT